MACIPDAPEWIQNQLDQFGGAIVHIKNITGGFVKLTASSYIYPVHAKEPLKNLSGYDTHDLYDGYGGYSEFIIWYNPGFVGLTFDDSTADWEFGEHTRTKGIDWFSAVRCESYSGVGIEKIDVAKLYYFDSMFSGCKSFNGDVTGWDTNSATTMNAMFLDCHVFNQDISKWDVSKVTSMGSLLTNTYSFDADLSKWCVPLIDSEPMFAGNSGLSLLHYPQWGTCPGPRINAVDLDCFDEACKGQASTPPSLDFTSGASDIIYDWTTDDLSCLIEDEDTASPTFYFNTTGEWEVTCTLSSATAVDSPRVATSRVVVKDCGTPDPCDGVVCGPDEVCRNGVCYPAVAGADEFHFTEPNIFFTSRQDTAITTRDTAELNDYEKGIGRSIPIKRTLDRKPYL